MCCIQCCEEPLEHHRKRLKKSRTTPQPAGSTPAAVGTSMGMSPGAVAQGEAPRCWAMVVGSRPPDPLPWGWTRPGKCSGCDGRASLEQERRGGMALLKHQPKKSPRMPRAVEEPPAQTTLRRAEGQQMTSCKVSGRWRRHTEDTHCLEYGNGVLDTHTVLHGTLQLRCKGGIRNHTGFVPVNQRL